MSWSRGKAYAQDLRDRVFACSDGGQPVGVVARTLLVSVSYVSKVLSRRRSTGETAARPQRCHVPPKLAHLHQVIRDHVRAHPDMTLAELQAWLRETHQAAASVTLLSETLLGLGLTLKKDHPCGRTGPRRCRAGAQAMDRRTTRPRSRQACLH